MRPSTRALILSDGKPGHLNQSLGLIEALGRLSPLRYECFNANEDSLDANVLSTGEKLPELIVGTGSRTHRHLLRLGAKTKAATVVLMAPHSLILPFFDLCVPPTHDNLTGANVFASFGPLNRMQAQIVDPKQGVLLVGGPSKHADWDSSTMLAELHAVCMHDKEVDWQIVTSRRTPKDFLELLSKSPKLNAEIVTPDSVEEDWLAKTLPSSGKIWVTADSASMLFEAASTNACVGTIGFSCMRHDSRICRAVNELIELGRIHRFSLSNPILRQKETVTPLKEADRIARTVQSLLIERKKKLV